MNAEVTLDRDAVVAFAEQVGANHAITMAALAYVGDRLGLWTALAATGSVTSREPAERTDLAERYLREWLAAQAAAGYHDAGRFTLTRASRRARGRGTGGDGQLLRARYSRVGGHRVGRDAGPEGVQQAVDGDRPAAREREQREHGPAFGGRVPLSRNGPRTSTASGTGTIRPPCSFRADRAVPPRPESHVHGTGVLNVASGRARTRAGAVPAPCDGWSRSTVRAAATVRWAGCGRRRVGR
jgi:Rv2258c-like winged HTH domain